MEDFKRYCENAHLQILMLGWITTRLAGRQKVGHSGIDSIEQDFITFAKEHKQRLRFRFDKGDHLLILASPLLIGGVEAIGKIEFRDTRNEIINHIESQLTDFLKKHAQIETLLPYGNNPQAGNWDLAVRLRNSLSHFRYTYNPDEGEVRFKDFNPCKNEQTMDLTMSLFATIDFSYKFGLASCGWAQQNNHYPIASPVEGSGGDRQ